VFAAYLAGAQTPRGEVTDIAAENERLLRQESGRPVRGLADEIRANVEAFTTATRGNLGADVLPWYSGIELDVATGTGLLLAELRVHGFDLARSLGRPWTIAPADARSIVRASAVLAPWYLDREAADGIRTTFRLEIRGGPRLRIAIADGDARVEPADGPADCTIHADPAAFVLVAYGRRSRWWAIARGQLLAGGRHPWRALAFDRYFRSP
ncbi:MAG TPA: SCP2 sterol-binding domain-containing protein, partial [Actinomycetota bacterium]|nr:SCP2 sterol-binding domain-containing protein [Actinomycetota bacterium]